MHFEPADARPGSALLDSPWDRFSVAGGIGAVLGGPLVLLTFALVASLASTAVQTAVETTTPPDAQPARELEEEDVIEARFVVLGREPDERLPNREVPRLSTAPLAPAEAPTEATPPRPRPRAPRRPRPVDSVEDLLTRVGDRARTFAEIAEEREREGSPEGIEEGTQRRATEGDLYRGRLYSFFRRGWTVPTTLAREQVEALSTTARIQIGSDLSITSFSVQSGSGDALFDQSVSQQLGRLQASGQHIPPPPEDVAAQYMGRTIAVRFHGRQAR